MENPAPIPNHLKILVLSGTKQFTLPLMFEASTYALSIYIYHFKYSSKSWLWQLVLKVWIQHSSVKTSWELDQTSLWLQYEKNI